MNDTIKNKVYFKLSSIIEDTSNLEMYIEDAYYTIISYCNIKDGDKIPTALEVAIQKLALLNFRSKGKENITQESQGSRSRTYKQIGTYVSSLPSEIEVLCKPYRRFLTR